MQDNSQISEKLKNLQHIFEKMAVEVRFRKGYFKGGLCRLNEKNIIYLNRSLPDEKNIQILIQELSKFNLEGLDISPQIKEMLRKN